MHGGASGGRPTAVVPGGPPAAPEQEPQEMQESARGGCGWLCQQRGRGGGRGGKEPAGITPAQVATAHSPP